MAELHPMVFFPRPTEDPTEVLMDVRPLVMCKDCRFGRWTQNFLGEDRIACERSGSSFVSKDVTLPPEWYCADAEEKSDD